MSFSTKDGKKKFGSGFQAKRYDSFHPQETEEPRVQNTAKKPNEGKEEPRTDSMGMSKKSQPSVGDTSMTKGMHLGNEGADEHNEVGKEESRTDENGESTSPEEVVAQHGPAHTVTVHHDHTANKHHVMSHHGDGHMHESDHETAADAHVHGRKLSEAMADEKGEPDGDESTGDLASIFGGSV